MRQSKALSVAVINRALMDIEGRGMGGAVSLKSRTWSDYVGAVLWAGSSRATIWFDILGWSQLNYLRAVNWEVHAEDLLSDERADLTDHQVEFLKGSIGALVARTIFHKDPECHF